jgi:uncharacterized protein YgiM (DUF1202 family)
MLKTKAALLAVAIMTLFGFTVPAALAQTTPAEVTWTAQYWSNVDFSGPPEVTRTETAINHRWGEGSPHPAINADRFSARWTANVVLEPGLYRFTTVSDDGVRVWIGGEQIIDNWTVHAEEVDVATVSLDGGAYQILVEYFENTGLATMILTWERLDALVDCGDTYVVRTGDWLSRIARRCGVSVQRLLAANPQIVDPGLIWPGMVLRIPSPDVTATTRVNQNFRPLPATATTPITVIPAGTTVPVTGRNQDASWLQVTYQERSGWIAAWLVTVDGRLVDVPLIPVTGPVVTPGPRPEPVVILEPGPGSRVTSPVRVAGISDPAQHQTISVRLVLDDGTELAEEPAQIDAGLGRRGPYQVEVPFTVTGERQAFVQVFIRSPRDGRIVHLNSVGITLADAGPEEIIRREEQPARVTIQRPAPQAIVAGGVAQVSGFGLAGFEQTLVIQVQDEMGNVVGSEPVTVEAPDLGQPGPFSAGVAYNVTAAGPGRVVVRDISPVFGGDAYVTSVEIRLEP